MKKEIYILTGPINSGKTTKLEQWLMGRRDVYGILTPKIEGKRFFKNIETSEYFQMDADLSEENTITIGKHEFSSNAFLRATQIIKASADKKEGWLIIDEIGPLEIDSKGFDKTLREILNKDTEQLKIVLVVRESLREAVITHYAMLRHDLKNLDLTTNNN